MSFLGRAIFKIEHLFLPPKTCYIDNGIKKAADTGFKIPDPVLPPITQVGFNYTVEGDKNWNTPDEELKLPKIQAAVNQYINSQEFADFMMDPKNALDLSQTNGLTRSQVIDKLRSERAHVVVRFYYEWTRTVGYRNPGENIVYCNRKYHDYYTLMEEASNIAHELAHIINVTGPLCGFQHDYNSTARRPFSVNYRINACFDGSKQNGK